MRGQEPDGPRLPRQAGTGAETSPRLSSLWPSSWSPLPEVLGILKRRLDPLVRPPLWPGSLVCSPQPREGPEATVTTDRGTIMARILSIRREATGAAATGASVTGAMAVGARVLGPSAMGPLAIAVSAVGALAIGRIAIANAVIRKLRAEEVEIGSLKVRELEVAGQRWPSSPAPQAGARSGHQP